MNLSSREYLYHQCNTVGIILTSNVFVRPTKEREEVSAELVAAAMQGYRNELKRPRGTTATNFVSPKVTEPKGGLQKDKKLDRELYRKRQAAGGGIPSGSITSHEKNWNETESYLFAFISKQ